MAGISSFMGLQTALRGLLASQEAIDTTGHNIANANTPGYSRQRANLTESNALTIPAYSNVTGGGVQLGTGVDVTTINRIRNMFLDIQYRAQNTTSNYASTQASILDQVQTGLAEPSDHGLQSQLSAFWSAWSDLANAPTSAAAKQTVIDNATSLTQTFNAIDQQLSTIQTQTATQYASLTGTGGQLQSDAEPDRGAQRLDQPGDGGRPEPQRLDGQARRADRRPLHARQRVGDRSRQRTAPDHLRRRRDTAGQRHDGQLAREHRHHAGRRARGAHEPLRRRPARSQHIARRSTGSRISSSPRSTRFTRATPFFSGNTAGTIGVAATTATMQTTTTGNPGANDVAQAIAALSGGAVDQSYAAFISGVGSDVQVDPEHADDDAGSARLDRQPAQERVRRVARRGDDESRELPARLSGVCTRDDDARRHARHADQPHGGCSHGTDHQPDDPAARDQRPDGRVRSSQPAPRRSCPPASGSTSPQTIRTEPARPCC